MSFSQKDWRANIKNIDNLYDLDPVQIMVFLRHQYLESAKDLTSHGNEEDDVAFGFIACDVVESLQFAIEQQMGVDFLVRLEPA